MTKQIVYIDMDGVLVEFPQTIDEIDEISPFTFLSILIS
jgi:hypothetical protein